MTTPPSDPASSAALCLKLRLLLLLRSSAGTIQRPNVISCVTVHDSHDSDSSDSSPLSPETGAKTGAKTGAEPTATVTPPVNSQSGEASGQTRVPLLPGNGSPVVIRVLSPPGQTPGGSGKSRKCSAQQAGRPGGAGGDRHQGAAPCRSQPLNLSQVTMAPGCRFRWIAGSKPE